jgi:hypothetical protein
VFVELESPVEDPFTKGGIPGAKLNQAIRQVTDWQHWLLEHSDEFTMSLPKFLTRNSRPGVEKDLRSAIRTFKIVIGRRGRMTRPNDEYRASFYHLHGGRVEIMSYDRITDHLKRAAGMPIGHDDTEKTLGVD